MSCFLFLYRSSSSSLCTVFDAISSNIDEVLSMSSSSNVFVFGDINVHHKNRSTYSSGTDRPDELCYNFSLLSQWPYSQWLTFHNFAVSASIKFPSNSKGNAPILVLIGMVFVMIWVMLHGETSLKLVLLLLVVNFMSGLMLELMYVSLIVKIRLSLTHLYGFLLFSPLP